ncbi:O-antigen ligase family protein [Burkholderia latens]|uniref:O-antigen ligase family protein n=1 Tax=Burkholderia latens TaxID=488446 RepID=UPI00158B6903|nr:O-antigen ligase family protein [Burkholderia latens]
MDDSLRFSYGPRSPRFVTDPATRIAATLVWATLGIGLVLSPLGDFLSVYMTNSAASHGNDARISLLVRGVMIAGLLAFTLSGFRARMSGVRITIAAVLAVCVTLGAYVLGALTDREVIEQSVFVLKVFSFFVYPAAMALLSDRRLAQIESVVFVVLSIYGASIVMGAAMSIEMFRSYQAETHIRSGYKGIVYAQNEAAALIVVALGFAYLHALTRGWRARSAALATCMLVAAMLSGTKGAVVGALGMTCAYCYARFDVIKATRYVGMAAAVLVSSAILAYLFIPAVNDAVELSLRYFSHQGGRIGNDKMLTLLLSGRNLKFANVWDDLQQRNFVALLTGGYPVVRYMVEIDIPDLILMLGLPLFAVYFAALSRAFLCRGPRTMSRRFGRLFFVVLFAMASTAGHVLGSAVISPFLALIAVMIRRDMQRAGRERAY